MASSHSLLSVRNPITPERHGTGRFVLPRERFAAAYVETNRTAPSCKRPPRPADLLNPCRLCPRQCEVNRRERATGVCRIGRLARVSSAFPHHGERTACAARTAPARSFSPAAISTVSFARNLRSEPPQRGPGSRGVGIGRADVGIAGAGCHNLNFVTPATSCPRFSSAGPRRGTRAPHSARLQHRRL